MRSTWSPACKREVAARDAYDDEGRMSPAGFPARKSLEEFDLDHASSLARRPGPARGHPRLRHREGERAFPSGRPEPARPMAIGLGIRACQANHRVLFATASRWVARLVDAHHTARL